MILCGNRGMEDVVMRKREGKEREGKGHIGFESDMMLLRRWRDQKWCSISTTIFMYERKNDA